MADDPVTITADTEFTLANGVRMIEGTITGPADYDATNGAAADFSDYFDDKIYSVCIGGVDAKADALVLCTYVNDDYEDTDGGACYFTWEDADGSNARVLENVADTTDLSGYVWKYVAFGI